ncbi:DUF2573 domain-containing protein [Bacillus canaveralius]|uniref:DUF2573 domain-containing protein n=1 Tax=Bacillus canaveralius TaxID=1403243 RepID=A0A2N5GLZ9_9BACI|nr:MULTISPECIES: YusU family protein [Bacillus]PLR82886.1 DUF2573 domain-containing protein [Bacillus canaveralius]PLR85256.1 DUF2573 domain-containing protein [Bacillus sp. V33-4]PLR97109.1 DUF2573 domain-containing protein [Bacillus canaveralius]RSK55492.1 DUF2573 family protein [Bacillus canaveralius]
MDEKFLNQFEALLDKYTELLIGESNEDLKEKVKVWALYSYIAKSMPPLAKHWNEMYPEAKEEVKTIISEIKSLNEAHRQHGGRAEK